MSPLPLYVNVLVIISNSPTHELQTCDVALAWIDPREDPSPIGDESNVGDESHSIKNEVRGDPPS